MVYYPIPLHQQKAFAELSLPKRQLSNTKELCKRVLSLPMHPYLSESDIHLVCNDLLNANS